MCGIAGILDVAADARGSLLHTVNEMALTITHRGPDDHGAWQSDCGRVAFAHRRLSIVDLSPLGHQPMHSASKRYTVIFNGEIYNHRKLREELRSLGHSFRGGSDTEVLLAGVESWGLEQTLRRIVGMFSIALWDRERSQLSLCRDRLGEKPLYVSVADGRLCFASELAALTKALPRAGVDPISLHGLLQYGYVPESRSILEGVHKFPAGGVEHWIVDANRGLRSLGATRYWSVPQIGEEQQWSTPAAAVEQLHQQMRATIADQMVADVPVGCLLSGGIDSTAVAAVMQSLSQQSIKTFTVSFADPAYDEGQYARAVAEHLRTDHEEVQISPESLIEIALDIGSVYDEPLGNPGQIPMVAVSRQARRKVTVCLSGDGGDELFGGYNRYYWSQSIHSRSAALPSVFKRAVAGALRWSARTSPDVVLRTIQRAAFGEGPVQDMRGKFAKLADVVGASSPSDAYLSLLRRWPAARVPVSDAAAQDPWLDSYRANVNAGASLEQMTQWDLLQYLPGDGLAKVDRASMSVSLEMRAPLLDHNVCALARRMLHVFGQESFHRRPKWPLRDLVDLYVPRRLMERPKMGFSVPLAAWLRRELRPWADALLNEERLHSQGLLVPGPIRHIWSEHQSGRADHSVRLWPIIVFQDWLARHGGMLSQSGHDASLVAEVAR